MGYSFEMFTQIGALGLRQGARILDIGSQDTSLSGSTELGAINQFISQRSGKLLDIPTPATVPAREVFRRAGFDYTCTDVDEREGTVYVDLASLDFPKRLRDHFDLVANCGTTEHLANPVGGFLFAHYCTKIGGIMFHDVPIFGMANHGLMNPTPKFWHALIGLNEYEVLDFTVRQVDNASLGAGNLFNAGWSYMKGDLAAPSAIVRVVLRRKIDRIFIPPYDAELPAGDTRAQFAFLSSSMQPFVAAGVYSKAEVEGHLRAFVGIH
jgi:hypothetical protein